jgi:hypothetical protein
MQPSPPPNVRLTTLGMRRMLLAASVLVFIVGIQLFILGEMTDTLFAWTIKNPLTAAFLGAAYWASFAMEFLASRRRVWAYARIAIPAVLIFTGLTLVVTLLHLGQFHLASPNLITRGAAWAWLIVYAVVPPLMAVLLIMQLRAPGGDPPRQSALPGWVRAVLLVHAVVMIPLGLALLLVPQATVGLWPWALTPLTGRAIGAWSLALGVAAAHATWENDWARVHVATMSYTVFGVFELIGLARYPGNVDWSKPQASVYVLFLVSVLVVGIYGWLRSSRDVAVHDALASQAAT